MSDADMTQAITEDGLTGLIPVVLDLCTLDCVHKGDRFEIVSVDDAHARVQALRFGVAEGACVECVTRVPAGPLVIKSGRQEIAVGRSLAKRINVRRLSS